jgi:NAD-dependent SIR2 family protein deacetylase
MSTLWILGAGCSRNYALGTSPVEGLLPPLNNDFFVMAKKVLDFYPKLIWYNMGGIDGLDHLIEDLQSVYGYKKDESDLSVFVDPRLTLERVMNHFYLRNKLMGYEAGFKLPEAESRRTRALGELLAATLTESLKGPPCDKHASLARLIQKGDTVISMNYDLLMDNALYNIGKLTDAGYNVRFDRAFAGGHWIRPDDGPSGVDLLKLHGSLNWLKCRNCGFNLLLRGIKGALDPAELLRQDFSCPRCKTPMRLGLERLIIPPAATKDFSDMDIRYLWQSAPRRLSETEQIVSIGYRFSESDSELEMLLREAIGQRVARIVVVNRHATEIERRFRSVFPESKLHRHMSLAGFFGHRCGRP